MIKTTAYAVLLAAFLGITSASRIIGWTYPETGFKNIVDQDYFKLRGIGEIDVGYNTIYKGDFDDTVGVQTETYGLALYSYAETTWQVEVADHYSW